MGFFDSIFSGVKGAFDTVKDAVSSTVSSAVGAAGSLFNNVVKPVITGVAGVAVPVISKGVDLVSNVGNRVLNIGDRLANVGIDTVSGFSKILTNPFMLIGGGILAIIVLTKIK